MPDFATIAATAIATRSARPAQRRTDYSDLHAGASALHKEGWSVREIVRLIRQELPEWQEKATEAQLYTAIARYLRNHAK